MSGSRPGTPRHGRRIALLAVWVAVIVAWVIYQRSTGDTPTVVAQSFIDTARGAWWAILLFVAFYTVRPLVLFPATVLTIAGGILFGPVIGIIATIVGANLSALFAYGLARVLGPDRLASEQTDAGEQQRLLSRWATRMRKNSFSTVLVMRFLFLPFDLVAYAAGFLRIKVVPFILATAIGSLPGTVAFVLAGASIERIDQGVAGLDARILGASAALFVSSLVGARLLSRREGSTEAKTDEQATVMKAST